MSFVQLIAEDAQTVEASHDKVLRHILQHPHGVYVEIYGHGEFVLVTTLSITSSQ